MNGALRVTTWNANGLLNHQAELCSGKEPTCLVAPIKINSNTWGRSDCDSFQPDYATIPAITICEQKK